MKISLTSYLSLVSPCLVVLFGSSHTFLIAAYGHTSNSVSNTGTIWWLVCAFLGHFPPTLNSEFGFPLLPWYRKLTLVSQIEVPWYYYRSIQVTEYDWLLTFNVPVVDRVCEWLPFSILLRTCILWADAHTDPGFALGLALAKMTLTV